MFPLPPVVFFPVCLGFLYSSLSVNTLREAAAFPQTPCPHALWFWLMPLAQMFAICPKALAVRQSPCLSCSPVPGTQ